MIRKQCLWRVSKKFLSIVLLVSSIHIVAMERLSPDATRMQRAEQKSSRPKSSTESWHGETLESLEAAFRYAPPKAKQIVDILNDPDTLGDPGIRANFFIGQPGVGKTTTALAIPYMAGWACKFVRATELQRQYRHGTKESLLEVIGEVEQSLEAKHGSDEGIKGIVVVIDEVDALLNNPHDSHLDTDSTSKAIQGFIDEIRHNEKLFFIGTMNDDTRMSEPMRSRFELDRIRFESITDPEHKRAIFKSKMKTPRMELHSECDDRFLDTILEKITGCPPRSYVNMRKDLSRDLHLESPDSPIRYIQKRHLVACADRLLTARKELKIGTREETDAERQERLFKEGLRSSLLIQMHQKQQTTYGTNASTGGHISGNIGGGLGGIGAGIGAGMNVSKGESISDTTAPGLSLNDAKKIWKQFYPNEEFISNEDEYMDRPNPARQARERAWADQTRGYRLLSSHMLNPNESEMFLEVLQRVRDSNGVFISEENPDFETRYTFNRDTQRWDVLSKRVPGLLTSLSSFMTRA